MEKTDRIDQAVQVASDSGRHINTLTVLFITLIVYILISAASIDHAAILLDKNVIPPKIESDISVKQFTFASAVIILVLHIYLLLNLAALRDQIERVASLQNSESKPFQFAYPIIWIMQPSNPGFRKRLEHVLMRLLYLLAYALVPLGALAYLQLVMLPSHRTSLAWTITLAMLLDSASIALALPLKYGDETARLGCLSRAMLVPILITILSLNLLIVHGPLHGSKLLPLQWNLTVSSHHLVDMQGPLVLRERDLRGGRFVGINLSGADLRGTDLRGANFTSTVLKGATFLPAGISRRQWDQWTEPQRRAEIERIQAETCQPRADEECEDDWDKNLTRLENANFSNADLTGASLALTRLSDVNLSGATLTSADLSGAMAQRANLNRIQADHSKLFLAQLDGASASHADLWKADLRGVSAVGTRFLGTDLGGAQLGDGVFQAAVLVDVMAQGADFVGASLEGADLRGAKLVGTTGLNLHQVIATHVDLSRAAVDSIGGQPPFLADLRAAQQHEIARTGSALIIEPDLEKRKGRDDLVIQPYDQSVLVDPQSWPGNSLGSRKLYCKMAFALEKLESAQKAGSVPGSYLTAALEEIAEGERVPRIRALEKALGDDEYCQGVGPAMTDLNTTPPDTEPASPLPSPVDRWTPPDP